MSLQHPYPVTLLRAEALVQSSQGTKRVFGGVWIHETSKDNYIASFRWNNSSTEGICILQEYQGNYPQGQADKHAKKLHRIKLSSDSLARLIA